MKKFGVLLGLAMCLSAGAAHSQGKYQIDPKDRATLYILRHRINYSTGAQKEEAASFLIPLTDGLAGITINDRINFLEQHGIKNEYRKEIMNLARASLGGAYEPVKVQ